MLLVLIAQAADPAPLPRPPPLAYAALEVMTEPDFDTIWGPPLHDPVRYDGQRSNLPPVTRSRLGRDAVWTGVLLITLLGSATGVVMLENTVLDG